MDLLGDSNNWVATNGVHAEDMMLRVGGLGGWRGRVKALETRSRPICWMM